MNWRKRFEVFKVGDKVIKARPYSETEHCKKTGVSDINYLYCRFGGEESDVPIGTIGMVYSIKLSINEIYVTFPNRCWLMDIGEVQHHS